MKPAVLVATVLLTVVALLHLLRLLLQLHFTVGSTEIPMWASIPAVLGFGALAVWLGLEQRKRSPLMSLEDQSSTKATPCVYNGHEFEALKCRFENQTELLHRMTLIDLRIFTGYIALQLGLGAWIATNGAAIGNWYQKAGLMILDLVLAVVAAAMLFNGYKRRKEVVGTVKNCNIALGYETEGTYLNNKALNAPTTFRPWAGWYFAGIVFGVLGIVGILFS